MSTFLTVLAAIYVVGFIGTFFSVGWQRYESFTYNIGNKLITALVWPLFLAFVLLS